MKKYVQKLLAGIIALAMILGNLAGAGVTVARASGIDDEEQTVLNVIVKDEQGKAVPGIKLCLKFDGSSSGMGSGGVTVEFDKVTNSEGKASLDCSGLAEVNEDFLFSPWYTFRRSNFSVCCRG